jgi:hypothetical protein
MEATMEADLHRLLEAGDAHYYKKLESVLWNGLYVKDGHVFWGPSSSFVDSLRARAKESESESESELDDLDDEFIETFFTPSVEVEKSLADIGWKRVEWSCDELSSNIEKFYCDHCISSLH